MRKPIAREAKEKSKSSETKRPPKTFAPQKQTQEITSFVEQAKPIAITPTPKSKNKHWLRNIFLAAVSLLISLAFGLAAEQLVRDLFARNEWLGYVGLAAIALAILALTLLAIKEIFALLRLNQLDDLRQQAKDTLINDNKQAGQKIIQTLLSLYSKRPELAHARAELKQNTQEMLDGASMIKSAERTLLLPLDKKAKQLIAASARRVAIVTAISPRALVDIAFVAYESFKLARAIAELYGARPSFFGSLKLGSSILSHLAITGGVALGDSVVQQLLGHGLAAKLSARLGEGLINGLMSVRVGIAAMRVTRPLPFETQKQPQVMDFMAELANITKS